MYKYQNRGIVAGIISGVFWGTPFVAPMILNQHSALDVTFGRFFFFGIAGLFFLPNVIRLFRQFSIREKIMVFALATSGFWLYMLFLSLGVQGSSGVIGSLIIGSLPVTITLFSKPNFNLRCFLGLGLILLGLGFLLYPQIASGNMSFTWHGLTYLLIALFMWTWFAIKNSHFMAARPFIKSTDYSSLIGVVNFVVIIPIYLASGNSIIHLIHAADMMTYLVCSLVLGLGASWLANVFWAYSATHCPPAVGGTLIVSETVFGLLYSFIYFKRLPFLNEYMAIAFLIVGVILVITSQRLNKAH